MRNATVRLLKGRSSLPSVVTDVQADALTAVALYILSRAVMAAGVIFSSLPKIPWDQIPYQIVIWSQVHDDSGWYHYIAAKGYIAQDTPFFPLYPMLVRLVHLVSGADLTTAGLLISNGAYVAALFLLLRLFRRLFGGKAARWSVLLFSLYPMAIFNSSMYTESLFVLLIAATWLSLEAKSFWRAGVFGFFAVLTRNEGGLLLIPFVYALWKLKRENGKLDINEWLPAFLLPLAGMLYAGYLWIAFGHPFLFSTMEHLWGRHFLFPLVTLGNGFLQFPYLFRVNGQYGKIYYSIEYSSLLFSLFFLPLVYRYFSEEWFLFTLFMIMIPLSDPAFGVITIAAAPHYVQDWFFSFSRFVIPMVPLWGAAGKKVSMIKWRWMAVTISGIGLMVITALINFHYFVA